MDAGSLSVRLTAQPPGSARRGPILLRFLVEDPLSEVTGYTLELSTGGPFAPAQGRVEVEPQAGSVLVSWSSFEDVNKNGVVPVRLLAHTARGDASAGLSLELLNAADTERLVLTAHRLETVDGGGAVATGTGLSVLTMAADGGLLGTPERLTVGAGASEVRAAPHGRASAVLCVSSPSVSVVHTPLSAVASQASVGPALSLPHGNPRALGWSPDGRYLYVAGGAGSSGQPPTLWRFEPQEDLSSFGAASSLAALPGPPLKLAVDEQTGRLLVFCGAGAGSSLQQKLVLYSKDGTQLSLLEANLGLAEGLAFSPAGTEALSTSTLFGDEVRRYQVSASSVALAGPVLTTVPEPTDVVFLPFTSATGPLAIISTLSANRLVPLRLEAGSTVPLTAVTGVPLAAELDRVGRGTLSGLVLVSSVNQLLRVSFDSTGAGQNQGALINFGSGARNLAYGIAIQR